MSVAVSVLLHNFGHCMALILARVSLYVTDSDALPPCSMVPQPPYHLGHRSLLMEYSSDH